MSSEVRSIGQITDSSSSSTDTKCVSRSKSRFTVEGNHDMHTIFTLRNKNNELEQENRELKDEIEALGSINDNLQKKIAYLEKEHDERTGYFLSHSEEIKKIQEQFTDMQRDKILLSADLRRKTLLMNEYYSELQIYKQRDIDLKRTNESIENKYLELMRQYQQIRTISRIAVNKHEHRQQTLLTRMHQCDKLTSRYARGLKKVSDLLGSSDTDNV